MGSSQRDHDELKRVFDMVQEPRKTIIKLQPLLIAALSLH